MNAADNIFFDLRRLAALAADAIVGKTVRIRKPERVRIGAHSIVDDFCYISCGLTVGRWCHIGANSTIIGGDAHVTLADFVNLAPGCRLIGASNDYSGGGLVGAAIPAEFAGQSLVADITLGEHVLLGVNTVVLPGTQVPEGVSTGAFTLLGPRMKLEPWTLYVGAPARPLRKRASAEILEAARKLKESLGGI